MPDKLAVFDLDGTLCDAGTLAVSAATIAALDHLKATGVLPIVASGRSYYEVKDLLELLDLHTFILANGCYIVYHDQVIQNYQFPTAAIEDVLAVATAHHDAVGFFNQRGFAISEMTPLTRQHVARMRVTNVPIDRYYYRHAPVNFLNLYMTGEKYAAYQARFKDQLSILRYAPDAVDVMPTTVSKASGILKIKARLHQPSAPVYVFGDQNNDLSMFDLADYGIAMRQSSAPLKQKAAYVATSAHGVLEGLKHYQLIK